MTASVGGKCCPEPRRRQAHCKEYEVQSRRDEGALRSRCGWPSSCAVTKGPERFRQGGCLSPERRPASRARCACQGMSSGTSSSIVMTTRKAHPGEPVTRQATRRPTPPRQTAPLTMRNKCVSCSTRGMIHQTITASPMSQADMKRYWLSSLGATVSVDASSDAPWTSPSVPMTKGNRLRTPRMSWSERFTTPNVYDRTRSIAVRRDGKPSRCRHGQRLAALHDVDREDLRPLVARARIVDGVERDLVRVAGLQRQRWLALHEQRQIAFQHVPGLV